MPKFRKKPVVVGVEGPLTEPTMVTTAHGRVRAEAGDYVLTDPKTKDTWPIKPDIFAATYEPARGEATDIGIRVKEDAPKQGNGIRFYTMVRVDRNTFGRAPAKDARNLVRREFQFALQELMKAVDEEHKKLQPAEPAP